MTYQVAHDSRFPELADAGPAVSIGVLHIVVAGILSGLLGIAFGSVAGFGLWGMVLSYVVAGNLGVVLIIAKAARAT